MSDHDRAVLHAIFNPSMPLDSQSCDIQTTVATRRTQRDKSGEKVTNDEVRRSWQLQIDAIRLCDVDKNPDKALALFDKAATIATHNKVVTAAARNNRAQVRRLLNDNDGALDDLNYVISATDGQGPVACQAYTQRALLLRLACEDTKAMQDFQAAAALGCTFAKKIVSENNPYAAMCNKMLMQMFANLREGKSEDAGFTKETFSE